MIEKVSVPYTRRRGDKIFEFIKPTILPVLLTIIGTGIMVWRDVDVLKETMSTIKERGSQRVQEVAEDTHTLQEQVKYLSREMEKKSTIEALIIRDARIESIEKMLKYTLESLNRIEGILQQKVGTNENKTGIQ